MTSLRSRTLNRLFIATIRLGLSNAVLSLRKPMLIKTRLRTVDIEPTARSTLRIAPSTSAHQARSIPRSTGRYCARARSTHGRVTPTAGPLAQSLVARSVDQLVHGFLTDERPFVGSIQRCERVLALGAGRILSYVQKWWRHYRGRCFHDTTSGLLR
uniref:Putative secreted protein n=1 Tax=Anopheles triannulatus TaxID=58253 RepID=A0A2M4B5F6_9DIPT